MPPGFLARVRGGSRGSQADGKPAKRGHTKTPFLEKAPHRRYCYQQPGDARDPPISYAVASPIYINLSASGRNPADNIGAGGVAARL
jgi:hypothetical protein